MRTSETVQRGAAFLDERLPGWRDRVNPDTLKMESSCDCVLGQVLGSYGEGAQLLGLTDDELRELGFYRASNRPWATLANAWRKVLA